jgi:hypothetical protein
LRLDPAVATANRQVAVTVVCELIGMDVAAQIGSGRSRKLFCPFGPLYHADGGLEAAMRIYPDTNHAYCFACHSSFTPVWLAAQVWGVPPAVAAKALLDRVGYRPDTTSPVQAFARASSRRRQPNATLLAEALKTFCARVDPCWETDQFDTEVATVLARCLALCALVRSDEDAQHWLVVAKHVMAAVLTSARSATRQP